MHAKSMHLAPLPWPYMHTCQTHAYGGVRARPVPTCPAAPRPCHIGLLSVQLAVTAAVSTVLVTVPRAKLLLAQNPWVLLLSMLGSFVMLLALVCSEQARRTHPTNLLLLGAFTVFESLLVGAACATYDTNVVALAFVVTAAVRCRCARRPLRAYPYEMPGARYWATTH